MVRETENHLETWASYMGEVDKVSGIVSRIKDKRRGPREEAEVNARRYALGVLKRVDEDFYNDKEEKDLTKDQITTGLNGGYLVAIEDASNTFKDNLENIVNGLSTDTLEDIAKTKQILDSASGEDRKLVETYSRYKGLDDLVDRYNEGNPISKEELKLLTNMVSEHKAKVIADNFKGYSPEVIDAMAEIGRVSIDDDYMKKVGKEIISESKKEYDELIKEKDRSILDYTREKIVELGGSENEKGFQEAMNLVYQAHTGKLREQLGN